MDSLLPLYDKIFISLIFFPIFFDHRQQNKIQHLYHIDEIAYVIST